MASQTSTECSLNECLPKELIEGDCANGAVFSVKNTCQEPNENGFLGKTPNGNSKSNHDVVTKVLNNGNKTVVTKVLNTGNKTVVTKVLNDGNKTEVEQLSDPDSDIPIENGAQFSFGNQNQLEKNINSYHNKLCDNPILCNDDQLTVETEKSTIIGSEEALNVLEMKSSSIKNGYHIVNESVTPTASCLKANSKPTSFGGAHVQFKTPCGDEVKFRDSIIFCNEQTSDKEKVSKRILIPEINESLVTSISRRNSSKKRRQPSGSSIVSGGSKTSLATNESKTEFERQALDGGWGWVVVFASFMVHCIADGVTMSFGILYVELLDYFKESKSVTSWVGSLFMAIPLLAGPLASYATDTYGCRAVTIWGSVISCLGFLLGSYSNSIVMLYLTVGLVAGLGLAACYVAAIVIVAFYFEKYRSLATGIAVAGSGIGTFMFAPIIQHLIDNYGWRGCMILLAGIFLNMAVCGALMRDLEWKKQKPGQKVDPNATLSSEMGSFIHSSDTLEDDDVMDPSSTIPSLVELKRLVQSGDIDTYLPHEEFTTDLPRSKSLVMLPTFLDNPEDTPEDMLPYLSIKSTKLEAIFRRYPHLLSSHQLTKNAKHIDCIAKDSSLTRQNKKTNSLGRKMNSCKDNVDHIIRALKENKKDSSFRSQDNLNDFVKSPTKDSEFCSSWNQTEGRFSNRDYYNRRQSMSYRGAIIDILRYRLRSSSCPNISRSSKTASLEVKKKDALKELLFNCVDLSYCNDSSYVIFAMSNFILYVFYDTVYMYLTDYAQEIGIPADEGANLISAIGILNCIGMVLMGYMGDKPWCSPLLIYNASMVACGLSVIAMPFIVDYWLLAAASAIFGLFISANYALTAVILVEMISLEAFGKSYGMLLLIQGIANLIGPPLVGFLSDATGDYVIPFVISGVFIVICGLMLSFIPLLKRHKYKSQKSEPTHI